MTFFGTWPVKFANSPCEQLWPAEYLHGTTKRVSIIGCQYAIKRLLVNDRLLLMNFRSKKVATGLPFYVSQPLMDK